MYNQLSIRPWLLTWLGALLCLLGVEGARAACDYDLTPTARTHGYGATTGSVTMATSGSCAWTVENNNDWITILSGASGTGDGIVTYALAGNGQAASRSGVLRVGGQLFTVTQAGVVCTFTISPNQHDKCFNTTTGTVQVTTQSPCVWTVENPTDWIVITSGNGGTGSGKLYYTVMTNPGLTARTGVVTIAGQSFNVRQAPYPLICAPDKMVECGAAWAFDPPTLTDPAVRLEVTGTVTNLVSCGIFTATRTWAAIDRCENRATCAQTVVGTNAPVTVICPPDRVVSCDAAWNFDEPQASSPCGFQMRMMSTVTNTICGPSYVATRTWEISDGCTNVVCSQTIIVTAAPLSAICAPDRSVLCGEAWAFDPPQASGSCGVQTLIVSTVTNAVCGPFLSATRTWQVTDGCTTNLCSQTISVTGPPLQVTCPPNRTVLCDEAWDFGTPQAASPCGVETRLLGTVTNAVCGRFLTATRSWEITDGCATNLCSQTITVTGPPLQVTCPPNRTVLCGEAWDFGTPQAASPCGVETRLLGTITNVICGQFLTATRSWEITDGCTTNLCSQVISVTGPPLVVICPPDRTVLCDEAWDFGTPQAASPCGVEIRLLNTVTNAGCGQALTAIRTWEVTDQCVTNLCSQTVNVVVPPPIIICPPDMTVTLTNGLMHCPKTLTEFRMNGGTATNGSTCDTFLRYRCAESQFLPNSNGCGGILIRTFTLTDSCSNSASCIQTIFVLGSNTSATVTVTLNDGCDVPPLAQQMANPVTMSATVNASVNAPSYLTTTFSNVPPGYVVTNGGPYLGWCMDYAGEILPGKVYPATLYRTVDALPAHLPQANWDRVNYILNHKQGTSIDIQNALWHFIGGPVPATDALFFPATATASNLIADAEANGAGFAPGPADVYGIIMDLGFNKQSGRTNQLNIIEARCQPGDACMGGNVTLCALVSGNGPFTYQWLKNADPIVDGTNQCLVVTNLLPAEAGQYCVRVSGACNTTLACLTLPACRPGAPAPRVAELQFLPGVGAQLAIYGKPNRTYRVLCGEEAGDNWIFIGNATTDANGVGEFMDESALEAHCRLYKLQDPTAP